MSEGERKREKVREREREREHALFAQGQEAILTQHPPSFHLVPVCSGGGVVGRGECECECEGGRG